MYDFFFFWLGHVVEHQIIASNNRSEGYNFSTFSLYGKTQESRVIKVFP